MMKLIPAFLAGFVSGCSSVQASLSDHFDGERFRNPWSHQVDQGIWDVLKWKFTSTMKKWPSWTELEFKSWKNELLQSGEFSVTWINHASHLLQFAGLNVLTDPIYSRRASPVSWIGPVRAHDPGIAFDSLPKIDVVLVSHNHYDHMDQDTIERLAATFNPLFIVPLGNRQCLVKMGARRVVELDWYERTEISEQGSSVTVVPAQHWSQRGFSRNIALWGGFVIESAGHRVYFAGDTGYAPFFKQIGERFPRLDLSILPIGAYEPRWFMKVQHLNPEEAVEAHVDLGSIRSMATHFGTFQMTDEGIDDPPRDLVRALERRSFDPASFLVPRPGERFTFR